MIKKSWNKASEHPSHMVGKNDDVVEGFFHALSRLSPHEMFRVPFERQEEMVYMKSSDMNDLFWSFLHTYQMRTSWAYRIRYKWLQFRKNRKG